MAQSNKYFIKLECPAVMIVEATTKEHALQQANVVLKKCERTNVCLDQIQRITNSDW